MSRSVRSRAGGPAGSPRDRRPRNRLLAALPAADLRRLRRHLTTVPLATRQLLHASGKPIRDVYFLNGGVASITTTLLNGAVVEAATVGDEGLVGVSAFLSGRPVATGDALIQVPDTSAEKLSVVEFRRELGRHGALHDLVGRYVEVLLAQMMQSTACNTKHRAPERCARWLLLTHDRMRRRDFYLSHEFLAVMLGVRRPTVSAIAAMLQRAGFIRYTHGHVAVLDRKGLEAASCECYALMRRQFRRLRG